MARSDPRPSVRVTRGAGSGQHLASVLQEGRENANIDAGWDSSGESRFKGPPLPPARWRAERPAKKSPAQRGALVTHSLLARRFVGVTAIDIDVGRAHIAASHWAVPFIRLGRLCGICSRSNGIGLPTRARGEGRTTG